MAGPTGVADLFTHAGAAPLSPSPSTGVGDIFGHPAAAAPAAPPPPAAHRGGGGTFGFLDSVPGVSAVEHAVGQGAHVVAKTATGLASDAANIPGGLYSLGKAALAPGTHPSFGELGHNWLQAVEHPSSIFASKNTNADPLARQMVQMGKQTVQSVTDPAYIAAHPDQTLLTALGALGTAGKLGEAAGLLKAAPRIVTVRGGKGADTGIHTVHFLPSTNPVVRHLIQAPLDRIVQHGADNPAGRLGGFAAGRVGHSLDEQAQRQLHMASVPAKRLEAEGSKLGGRARGAVTGSRKVQQAALRLTAEQRTPEEALATHQGALEQIAQHTQALATAPDEATARLHEQQISRLGSPSDHAGQVKLLEQVRDRGLTTQTPEGNVVIHPQHPLLAAVDARLANAGHLNEAELARLDAQTARAPYLDRGGHLVHPTPDEITAKTEQLAEGRQARIDAPNRIHAGATYVAPTATNRGVALPAEIRQTARVASLQKIHDAQTARAHAAGAAATGPADAMIGNRLVGPGAETASTTQAAVDASHMRLAELERQHNAALDELAQGHFGPINPADVRARTAANLRAARQAAGVNRAGKPSGASSVKSVAKATIKQERRDTVDRLAAEAVIRDPAHPALAAWAARTSEIDRLRAQLNPDLGEKPAGTLTGPGRVITPKGGVKAEGTGAELSAAKTKLDRMQSARARRLMTPEEKTAYKTVGPAERAKMEQTVTARGGEKPTGIVGGEGARPGRQHIGYYRTEPTASAATISRSPTAIVGKAAEAVTERPFTGGSIERAHVPDNTTGIAARHLARIVKQATTSNFRRDVPGSATRLSKRDVLVNTQALKNAVVPDELRTALGGNRSTLDELAGEHAAMEALRQEIIPKLSPAHANDGLPHEATLGTAAPHGFKWVDQKMLGSLGRPAIPIPGEAARFVDAANAAQTAATVYYKIGHVATRAVTDAATNLIQGSLNPVAMTKAFRVWKSLSEAERDQSLAGVGGGGFSALPQEGLGRIGRAARAGSGFWAHHVDAPSRFLSLHYEAAKSGFGSAEKFKAFLKEAKDPSSLNPGERATIDGIMARADRAAIRYDGLNDFEKRYVQRAVWFYPWIKGATKFAGHVIVEHPVKSALLGQAGAQAAKNAQNDLGAQPSYNAGIFKVGGSDALPTTVNAGTLSPFTTPAQLVQAIIHANRPTQAQQLSGYLSPVAKAVGDVAYHLNPFGTASKQGTLKGIENDIGGSTPEVALLHALMATPTNQARKMFPGSAREGLLRFLIGSAYPRPENRAVANAAAQAERTAAGIK